MVEVGSWNVQRTQEAVEAVNHSYQESPGVEGAGAEVSHAEVESPVEVEAEELHEEEVGTRQEGTTEREQEGLLAVDAECWGVVGGRVQRHCQLEVHWEEDCLEA